MSRILAIDPGTEQSAYVVWHEGRPTRFAKIGNDTMLDLLGSRWEIDILAIEMIASYGMPVGREVFETAVWIGRFQQASPNRDAVIKVMRRDVKLHLCGSSKAKDANIRQALLDRFGPQGTKKAPGVLYGVKADIWSAVAIAVTVADRT